MEKVLDLKQSVYDLAQQHDDFLKIMSSLGFEAMAHCIDTNPKTKQLTLPQAMEYHQFDLNKVIEVFEQEGYQVIK